MRAESERLKVDYDRRLKEVSFLTQNKKATTLLCAALHVALHIAFEKELHFEHNTQSGQSPCWLVLGNCCLSVQSFFPFKVLYEPYPVCGVGLKIRCCKFLSVQHLGTSVQ